MAFSRQQFEAYLETQRKLDAVVRQGELRKVAQAEVAAKHLTHDPHWDFFLSILQTEIEKSEAGEAEAKESLVLPDALTAEQMMEHKIRAIRCRERANTLKSILAIPATLIADGEAAKERLREHGLD